MYVRRSYSALGRQLAMVFFLGGDYLVKRRKEGQKRGGKEGSKQGGKEMKQKRYRQKSNVWVKAEMRTSFMRYVFNPTGDPVQHLWFLSWPSHPKRGRGWSWSKNACDVTDAIGSPRKGTGDLDNIEISLSPNQGMELSLILVHSMDDHFDSHKETGRFLI